MSVRRLIPSASRPVASASVITHGRSAARRRRGGTALPPRSVNVDTPEKPKRPRWRKKRWRLAAAAWLMLPAAFVSARGPLRYAEIRGWVSLELCLSVEHVYEDVDDVLRRIGFIRFSLWWDDYAQGWQDAGLRHESGR